MKALAIYGGAAVFGFDFHFVVVFFVLTGVLLLVTGLILFVPSPRKKANNKLTGDTSEQKKKLSKTCLAGFILSALFPILLALNYFGSMLVHSVIVGLVLDRLMFLFPAAGMIISIIGLISLRKKDRTGRKFGIAGIVLPNAYVAIIVLMIIGNIVILIVHNSRTVRMQQNREIYGMVNDGRQVNNEYDVSQYKIPEGYDLKSLSVSVSEAELKEYAESKLQTIDSLSDKSARGKFQKSDFVIVRSDRFKEWLNENNLNNLKYSNGYAILEYDYTWEFAATGFYTIDVYKDPSDRFIIITNCGDQKVIAEFFEGIGKAVPTEAAEEPTVAPPFDGSRISSVDLEGVNSEGIEFTVSPDFVAGQDLVIICKSNSELSLGRVFKYDPNNINDIVNAIKSCDIAGDDPGNYVGVITQDCSLTKTEGGYALTIPSKCTSTNTNYYVELNNGAGLIIKCK